MPIWMFNGDSDEVVSSDDAVQMSVEMRACGADTRVTIYEGAGHVRSWERAYDEEALYDWFLSHLLPQVPTAVGPIGWGKVKRSW